MSNEVKDLINDNCINFFKQCIQVALLTIVLDAIVSDKKDILDKVNKWLEVDKNEL